MNSKTIENEFTLIDKINRRIQNQYSKTKFHNFFSKNVLTGIGDDAAILRISSRLNLSDKQLVCTTDSLVEGVHFDCSYCSAFEVGVKAMEVNLSDIAAMGAQPLYALVSLMLPKTTEVAWVDNLYKGLLNACFFHENNAVAIVGGNISTASKISVSIFLIGKVKQKHVKLRSNARIGDKIKVTGFLGSSCAGLHLLTNNIGGFNELKQKHKMPRARLDVINPYFLRHVHAMQDVSDGLISDVKHLCLASKVGAVINLNAIPLDDYTVKAAKTLNKDVLDMALYGGEDYELLYTVSSKHAHKTSGYVIGEVTSHQNIVLTNKNRRQILKLSDKIDGFNHFA